MTIKLKTLLNSDFSPINDYKKSYIFDKRLFIIYDSFNPVPPPLVDYEFHTHYKLLSSERPNLKITIVDPLNYAVTYSSKQFYGRINRLDKFKLDWKYGKLWILKNENLKYIITTSIVVIGLIISKCSLSQPEQQIKNINKVDNKSYRIKSDSSQRITKEEQQQSNNNGDSSKKTVSKIQKSQIEKYSKNSTNKSENNHLVTGNNNHVGLNGDVYINNNGNVYQNSTTIIHNKPIKPPARHLNHDDINVIQNQIPLSYVIEMWSCISDKECSDYADELASQLIALGYNVQRNGYGTMSGVNYNDRFDLRLIKEQSKAEILIYNLKALDE